jgi:hypothetical protein
MAKPRFCSVECGSAGFLWVFAGPYPCEGDFFYRSVKVPNLAVSRHEADNPAAPMNE